MTTHSVSSREGSLCENVFAKPKLAVSLRQRLIETLGEWRRRIESRRELAVLSDLDLKDIGYPAQAAAEKAKPFWRA
jgi:uncharacterized protein YjiS (DUF1127 family)